VASPPKISVTYDQEREKLREQRTVILVDDINDDSVACLVDDLYILSAAGDGPITLIIGSDGGDVMAMLTALDAISYVRGKGIYVVGRVVGRAMSAAFVVLQACNMRQMSQNAFLMAHGISGFNLGVIKDQEANVRFLHRLRDMLSELLSKRGKRDVDFWKKLLNESTPTFLDAKEAQEWGLIDEIV